MKLKNSEINPLFLGRFPIQANFQSAAEFKLYVKLSAKNSEMKFEHCRIRVNCGKLIVTGSSCLKKTLKVKEL